MECLFCKEKIDLDWIYCGKCGTNIKEYKKAEEFIEKGIDMEEQREYSKAAKEYKNALSMKVKHLTALEHLERVTAKEEEIISSLEKATEFFTEKKWKHAVKMYEYILQTFPAISTQEIQQKLFKAKTECKKRMTCKLIATGIVVLIVAIGATFSYRWTQSPERRAEVMLKESTLSKDTIEREMAIEALGRIGDKKYLPLIKDAANDKIPEIRIAAIKSIGEMKDSSTIPLLKESLFDRDWRVSVEAAKALAILGDTVGIQVLRQILK